MTSFRLFSISALLLSITFLPFSSVYAQEAMSSPSYRIQSDSINNAGDLSTSSNYKIQDTAGETGTGLSDSQSYGVHDAGYQGVQLDIVPPSQVPFLNTTTLTSDRIELDWGQATDDYAVAGYYIYRDGIRVGQSFAFPRTYMDSGLFSNTTYAYNVSAFDTSGHEGEWSATSTAQTLLAPVATTNPTPTPFVAGGSSQPLISIVPGDTSALVTFNTAPSVVTSIFWGTTTDYASGNLVEKIPTDSHHFILSPLTPSTNYFLKIVFISPDGHQTVFDNIPFRTLSAPFLTLPPNVVNFSATAETADIALDWTLPADKSIVGVRIVRSTSFYPSTPDDGQVIFENKDASGINHFVDANVKAGTTYYYAIFAEDLVNNFSSGVVTSARILLPGETAATSTPLENIAQSGNVDPKIAALTLNDFLFIQSGNSVPVNNGLVTITGDKNLTVALTYYRVPEILKTITVTLVASSSKSFTFLLRANRDKTRYEATIGALGNPQIYKLALNIIDFKNQGQKKINGTLAVLAGDAVPAVLDDGSKKFFGWGLLAVILAGAVVWFFEKKKKKPEAGNLYYE
jgi:chitodextrinase